MRLLLAGAAPREDAAARLMGNVQPPPFADEAQGGSDGRSAKSG